MITSAIPIIAVSGSARAEDDYCRALRFQRMFAYPPRAQAGEGAGEAPFPAHRRVNSF